MAERSSFCANEMPLGATGMTGDSFVQINTRTLPALEKGWQRLGYRPDVHYWVKKYPPANLNIPKAIYHVRDPSFSIFWWNGHVFHMMSCDRPGLANGKTVDAMIADEARFMPHQRYVDDIAPTNRGNKNASFAWKSCHHSITMYSDMPTDPGGKWLLEKEQSVNKKQINTIFNIQVAYNEMELECGHPQTTAPRRKYLRRKMYNYAIALNELRKNSVFYIEASSLENIEVLGVDQFKQWRRELKPHVFDAAILNKRVVQVDKGFYPLLYLDKHTYNAFDYSFIDSSPIPINSPDWMQDSRCDGDINKSKPLDIAFDCNGYFNCCAIGQEHAKEYRILNAMYVKDEERLEELCHKVINYYRNHPTKVINLIYDHTFIWTDSTRTYSYADLITKLFTAKGWRVVRLYIGQQPKHDTRYRMWGAVLKEDDRRMMRVRLNKTNCSQLLIALQRAAVRQGTKGFEKDKRDEARIHTIPPEEATHFTDAFDTLYIGKYKHQIGYSVPVTDLIM